MTKASPIVGIYMRVSTIDQSTEMQRKELLRYAKARDWDRITIYEDRMTGTTTQRPRLQSLLEDANHRRIDLILIWKLDRLARSLRDLIDMLDSFARLGVTLVSLKENIDMGSSTGRLLVHLLAAFSQFERDLIVSRVKSGLSAAKDRGIKLGRPQIVNPTKVLELRRKNLSLREIAIELKISKSAVHKVLKERPVKNGPSTRFRGARR